MNVLTLYYGANDSAHLPDVLRSAGYVVDECISVGELVRRLRSEQKADLVCIADACDWPAEGALAAAHAFSSAPIVLFRFRSSNHHYLQRVWDLEVEALKNPCEWLLDVGELLGLTRATFDPPPEVEDEASQLRLEAIS